MAKSMAKVMVKETAKEMVMVMKVDLGDEVNLVLVQELVKKTEKATVVEKIVDIVECNEKLQNPNDK